MAQTFLDQIVEYPFKVMLRIAQDDNCVALLLNKSFDDVSDDDKDAVLRDYIKDYQYVDETTQETAAFVLVEMDVHRIENFTVKGTKLYVTIACHKDFMGLNPKTYKGTSGNRRDNLVRYIDKILNNSQILGIGKLKLSSVRTISPISGFTIREIAYEVPDFNIVAIN